MSKLLCRTWVGMCSVIMIAEPSAPSQEPPRSIEKRLDDVRRAYLDVAQSVYDGLNAFHGRGPVFDELTWKIQRAEADYTNAKLEREFSELELRIYDESTYPLERAVAAGSVKLATANLERIRGSIADQKNYLERSRKQTTNTLTEDLILQGAEVILREEERRRPVAEAELARETSRLDRLEKVLGPRRRAEVLAKKDEALGKELQKQSEWMAAKNDLQARISVARSLATEDEWGSRLANLDGVAIQLAEVGKKLRSFDDAKRIPTEQEARDIEDRIETSASRIRNVRRSLEVSRLRQLTAILSRFSSGPIAAQTATSPPSPIVGLLGDEGAEVRLDGARQSLIRACASILDRLEQIEGRVWDIPSQELAIRAAEACYKAAANRLAQAREVQKEYVETFFVRERTEALTAVAMAESTLKGSQEDLVRASAAMDRARRTATTSLPDADALRRFEIALKFARHGVQKSELELEHARNELDVLDNQGRPVREKELAADVERAISREISQRQTLTIEREKLAISKRPQTSAGLTAIEKASLRDLLGSIRDEAEIRGRIATTQSNDKPRDANVFREIESAIAALELKARGAERAITEPQFLEMARKLAELEKPTRTIAPRRGAPRPGRELFDKLRSISPEDRATLKSGTEEKKREILKKAGFTDEELEEMRGLREQPKR
ncbi:hypothetical protein [Aquisphaera insulae]|uniref:hypothetical protein n=1 Tax=Aquisphaera insulae TaxID=2712864 RepID=UPI0013E9E27B|nr:hypothetical protein [Aquisphaera insulae]